ncbi:MAG TPA: hypothetical protein VK892_16885 [Pyrinomonadaceae bacterium]|nr:hypothetical protein [Pyrinomonadaceae bacterium]
MPLKDAEARKEYTRAYNREYYRRNRKHLLRKQKEKNRRHVEKVGAWLNELKKGLSCERCSESHPATLQFHHLDPKEKEFSIGMYRHGRFSKERLLKEIAKCEVICANCHAREHWGYLYE